MRSAQICTGNRKHDSTDDSGELSQISKQDWVKGEGHSHGTVHSRSLKVTGGQTGSVVGTKKHLD